VRRLYRIDDDSLFAYADHRDFSRASDDALWAHESHQRLIAAGSGAMLAHRVGMRYYDAETGQPLYYEALKPSAPPRPASLEPPSIETRAWSRTGDRALVRNQDLS
jgi:hypothetical protein